MPGVGGLNIVDIDVMRRKVDISIYWIVIFDSIPDTLHNICENLDGRKSAMPSVAVFFLFFSFLCPPWKSG